MVVQLVTAGGTFPWQTLPGPLAALHHVLPMSYAVDAPPAAHVRRHPGRARLDALILLGWLLVGLGIAAIGVTRMTHFRTLRDLQPVAHRLTTASRESYALRRSIRRALGSSALGSRRGVLPHPLVHHDGRGSGGVDRAGGAELADLDHAHPRRRAPRP